MAYALIGSLLRNAARVLAGVLTIAGLNVLSNAAVEAPQAASETSPQPADPATWTIQPAAKRDSNGGIIIAASTNLPDGLKLWVQLADGSTSKTQVSGGKFESEPFSNKGKMIQPGPHRVSFLAYFNAAWQQPDSVLQVTGKGGSKLKGKLFRKTDPDVIDSDRMLEYRTTVAFPTASRELEAISLVKSSTLVVDGERSSATVAQTVDAFLKPGTGITMGSGWKAIAKGSNIYEVQLGICDAANDGPAIWQADLSSRKVRYINKVAKDMSYLPPD
jgi:hypothetical protein